MTLTLDHASFRTTITDVRAAADRLRADRSRIDQEVDCFLDGGWTGRAADAFADGWADWTRASHDVLAGLDAMAALLGAVHADLAERDGDAHQQLDRIARRIVARLG